MAIVGPKGGVGKVKGLQSLQAKLKRLSPETRSAIKQALAESADEMVAMMKRLAPVGPPSGQQQRKGAKPGALRDSITQTWGGDGPRYAAFQPGARRKNRHKMPSPVQGDPDLSVSITAGNGRVRYAHIVEFGTAPHINGGKFAGSQHPGTAARPFFFPAYRALRKRVKSRITRATNKAAKAVASK